MERWGYEAVANEVAAPPDLLLDFEERRKRQEAAQRRFNRRDQLRKLVTHRRPLAAELSALTSSTCDGVPAVPTGDR